MLAEQGECLNVTLVYEGEFGFQATLTINVEKRNAGLYANLFYYNPQTGGLEYVCAGQIGEDGGVKLRFTHASDYVVVIDAEDMEQPETDMDADNDEIDMEETSGSETEKENTAVSWWITLLILAVVIAGTGIFIVMQKKKAEKNKAA